MKHADHLRLWRLVEGGVYDAFRAHPDYLTDHGRARAVESITKRVVGQLVGHANEARKRRPLGASRGDGCCEVRPRGTYLLPPIPRVTTRVPRPPLVSAVGVASPGKRRPDGHLRPAWRAVRLFTAIRRRERHRAGVGMALSL